MAGKSRAVFLTIARQSKRAALLAAGLTLAAVSACNTGSVLSLQPAVDVGTQTSSVPQYTGMQRLVPSNPYMTQAAYPRMDTPMSPVEQIPASETDCRQQLKRLGVVYTDLAPIHEGQCGIDYPVKVSAIGGVEMKPAASRPSTRAPAIPAATLPAKACYRSMARAMRST